MSRGMLTTVAGGIAALVLMVALLGAGLTTSEHATSGCPAAAVRPAAPASGTHARVDAPEQPRLDPSTDLSTDGSGQERTGEIRTGERPERATGPSPRRCAASNGRGGPVLVTLLGETVELPAAAGVTGTLRFPNSHAAVAAAAALSQLGVRYSWGGGNANGPTVGIRDGGVGDAHDDYRIPGFDCSGLTLFAYAQAGVALPRVSRLQQHHGRQLPWTAALPGDLLFWGDPVYHVALYLGQVDGRHLMIEAPYSGAVVRVTTVRTGGDFTAVVTRPHEGTVR